MNKTMNLKIKCASELCVGNNLYVYYVYDGNLYQDGKVNKGNALAFIYVKITSQNQHVIHIDIKDNRIQMDKIKELAKEKLYSVML